MYLPLTWTKSQLLDVLDKRIGALVKRRYTKEPVTHKEVLPRNFQGRSMEEFIFSIAKRPRDVIAFFNTCIGAAADQNRLATRDVRLAEGEYSRQRLRALADEWSADYPGLVDFAKILHRRPPSFKLATIKDDEIADLCLTIASDDPAGVGLIQSAVHVANGVMTPKEFKFVLARTFYEVGLVGVKNCPSRSRIVGR